MSSEAERLRQQLAEVEADRDSLKRILAARTKRLREQRAEIEALTRYYEARLSGLSDAESRAEGWPQ